MLPARPGTPGQRLRVAAGQNSRDKVVADHGVSSMTRLACESGYGGERMEADLPQ